MCAAFAENHRFAIPDGDLCALPISKASPTLDVAGEMQQQTPQSCVMALRKEKTCVCGLSCCAPNRSVAAVVKATD